MEKHDEKTEMLAETQVSEPGRRDALIKIGKYGAYAAPAVLALVLGKRAEAYCSLC
jgi:hypothetical protein